MEEDILMTPMGFLMLEHRLIERMVDLMEMELERIDRGKKVDIIFIDGAIDFAKTYADVCHHGKEEGIFFDKLAMKRLMPEHKDLMDELVLDHIESRKIVVNLARLSGFSLLENFFDAGSSVFSRIGVPGGGLNRL